MKQSAYDRWLTTQPEPDELPVRRVAEDAIEQVRADLGDRLADRLEAELEMAGLLFEDAPPFGADEVEVDEPDPCPSCDWLGCHGPECPEDPDPWTEDFGGLRIPFNRLEGVGL